MKNSKSKGNKRLKISRKRPLKASSIYEMRERKRVHGERDVSGSEDEKSEMSCQSHEDFDDMEEVLNRGYGYEVDAPALDEDLVPGVSGQVDESRLTNLEQEVMEAMNSNYIEATPREMRRDDTNTKGDGEDTSWYERLRSRVHSTRSKGPGESTFKLPADVKLKDLPIQTLEELPVEDDAEASMQRLLQNAIKDDINAIGTLPPKTEVLQYVLEKSNMAPFVDQMIKYHVKDRMCIPELPILTVEYVQNFLREPLKGVERPCVMQHKCTAFEHYGFILRELLLPEDNRRYVLARERKIELDALDAQIGVLTRRIQALSKDLSLAAIGGQGNGGNHEEFHRRRQLMEKLTSEENALKERYDVLQKNFVNPAEMLPSNVQTCIICELAMVTIQYSERLNHRNHRDDSSMEDGTSETPITLLHRFQVKTHQPGQFNLYRCLLGDDEYLGVAGTILDFHPNYFIPDQRTIPFGPNQMDSIDQRFLRISSDLLFQKGATPVPLPKNFTRQSIRTGST